MIDDELGQGMNGNGDEGDSEEEEFAQPCEVSESWEESVEGQRVEVGVGGFEEEVKQCGLTTYGEAGRDYESNAEFEGVDELESEHLSQGQSNQEVDQRSRTKERVWFRSAVEMQQIGNGQHVKAGVVSGTIQT